MSLKDSSNVVKITYGSFMPEPTLKPDGFEDAFIGTMSRCGQPTVLIYDYDKAVELLMARDGMSHEEAEEYMEFNVTGAWVGAGTPGFLRRCTLEEAEAQE